jgi:hypothetical protein
MLYYWLDIASAMPDVPFCDKGSLIACDAWPATHIPVPNIGKNTKENP